MGSLQLVKKLKRRRFVGKITSPLNKKLEQVKWGEFKLGDLFEKCAIGLKENCDKQRDISTQMDREFNLPLVNAKHGNNGVMYYGRENEWDSVSMSIDIVNDGAISTGDVYPQPQKTGVLYNAYLIKAKSCKVNNSKLLMFLSTAIGKAIKHLYGYEKKASWERVKNNSIFLPILTNGDIDFAFMENCVAELEAERVAELEAYLTASGFKDYELTPKEIESLRNISTLNFKEFNLERLFGKSTRGKRLKSSDRVQGNLPFVTAGEFNEGISDFIGNNVQIFSKNTTTIDMFGSAKYRNYSYGADDHIAVVHTENLEQNAAIFVTASIHKSSHNGQFNYGRNFYAKDADALNIMLPFIDDKPDFDAMGTLISAVKKLVIKDVVEYANNKIEATKQVIANN